MIEGTRRAAALMLHNALTASQHDRLQRLRSCRTREEKLPLIASDQRERISGVEGYHHQIRSTLETDSGVARS